MDDGAESTLSTFAGGTELGGTADGPGWICCHPRAPQQPGERAWQEPHRFQQELQGPAPLEKQLQEKVLGANQLANSLAEILPWLPHILAGVPCLSPSEGSR